MVIFRYRYYLEVLVTDRFSLEVLLTLRPSRFDRNWINALHLPRPAKRKDRFYAYTIQTRKNRLYSSHYCWTERSLNSFVPSSAGQDPMRTEKFRSVSVKRDDVSTTDSGTLDDDSRPCENGLTNGERWTSVNQVKDEKNEDEDVRVWREGTVRQHRGATFTITTVKKRWSRRSFTTI